MFTMLRCSCSAASFKACLNFLETLRFKVSLLRSVNRIKMPRICLCNCVIVYIYILDRYTMTGILNLTYRYSAALFTRGPGGILHGFSSSRRRATGKPDCFSNTSIQFSTYRESCHHERTHSNRRCSQLCCLTARLLRSSLG